MKLLDLIVDEGVKWPEGALYAAQDYDKELSFFSQKPKNSGTEDFEDGVHVWYHNSHYTFPYHVLGKLAEDSDTKVVTRCEYLEATVLSKKISVEVEDLSTLTIKYQSQKSLERALENVSKDYKQAADETLAKINTLLEGVSLEVVAKCVSKD